MTVRLTPRGSRGSRLFNPPPLLKSIFMAVNIGFYRLFGQRMRIQGPPLLLLTPTGAKTGKRRQAPLGWFEDDPPRSDAWLVVASAAGAASHPGWYINLARRPDDASIDIGDAHVAVTPQ